MRIVDTPSVTLLPAIEKGAEAPTINLIVNPVASCGGQSVEIQVIPP